MGEATAEELSDARVAELARAYDELVEAYLEEVGDSENGFVRVLVHSDGRRVEVEARRVDGLSLTERWCHAAIVAHLFAYLLDTTPIAQRVVACEQQLEQVGRLLFESIDETADARLALRELVDGLGKDDRPRIAAIDAARAKLAAWEGSHG